MASGGRPLFVGATIAVTFLLGSFGVDAGTDEPPYIAMFQDLEVTAQSSENVVQFVGSGFAPNSVVLVTIVDNATGVVVHEDDQVSDAVGQTDLELTFDPPLSPGNYSATITGVTPTAAPLRLSGALTIAEVLVPSGPTEAGSSGTPDTASTGSAVPSSGADNSAPADTSSTISADDTQQTSSSDDSSLAPWIIGGVVALSCVALIIVIIRRRPRTRN